MLGRECNCVGMSERGTLFTIPHDILIPGTGVNLNSHPLKWEVQIRPVLRSLRLSMVVGTRRVPYPMGKGLVRYGTVAYRVVLASFNWR
jgi:hypothetical protein